MKPSIEETLKFSFFTQSRDTWPPKRSRENEMWHAIRTDSMTNDQRRGWVGDLRTTSRRAAGCVSVTAAAERRNQLAAAVATYQNRVEIVGISLRIGRVDGQRHAVGEYRRQN